MNELHIAKLPETMTADEVWAFIARSARECPSLKTALREDAVKFAAMRNEAINSHSRFSQLLNVLRMAWASDDYLGLAFYRLRTTLRSAHIPLVPGLLHRICIIGFGIRIGDHTAIHEGLYLPHGNIVIDGIVTIGPGCTIAPWVTIGLKAGGIFGPQIDGGVFIGTGAKVLGNISVGRGATIGAGAVVVDDVPAFATVAGVPARVISQG